MGQVLHGSATTTAAVLARNLRRAGVSEGTIMQTGGWRTRSMLDRYNIQNRLDQREAMDALTLYRQQFDHPQRPTVTEVIQ